MQYVPLPVVGGYLGYVGYFCLAAGIGQGAGVEVASLASWANLLAPAALARLAPTLAAAAVLVITMARARGPWALPAVLVALPAAFYAVLLATGTSLAEAQDAGWALKPQVTRGGGRRCWGGDQGEGKGRRQGFEGGARRMLPGPRRAAAATPTRAKPKPTRNSQPQPQGKSTKPFWELYQMFNLGPGAGGICIPAMLRQLPKVLGLFLVVTFGSCLDVAAIQVRTSHGCALRSALCTLCAACVVCVVCALLAWTAAACWKKDQRPPPRPSTQSNTLIIQSNKTTSNTTNQQTQNHRPTCRAPSTSTASSRRSASPTSRAASPAAATRVRCQGAALSGGGIDVRARLAACLHPPPIVNTAPTKPTQTQTQKANLPGNQNTR